MALAIISELKREMDALLSSVYEFEAPDVMEEPYTLETINADIIHRDAIADIAIGAASRVRLFSVGRVDCPVSESAYSALCIFMKKSI